MVNDTTTLNGALSELGGTMADNLFSMGVIDADATDGLTTLANKILDIEPSISGLDLDTSLILHSSDDECLVGQSIMFWAELKADYDDESATDVDLSGVLTGATVEFKVGNTVLGSGVTDADGIAYYTHTFSTSGDYSITASFAGTENFDDCVSSSITVSVTYEMTITADKPILSFADSDVATITATLSDGVAGVGGETLSYEVLDKEDNVLDSGSDVTDSLGEISFTYQSAGVGDVQVIVYYGMFLQEIFVVEDCYDSITGQTDELTKFGSSISLRSGGGATLSYDSTNKYYKWSININGSESFIPINNATGLNDFTIEFDAYLQPANYHAIAGLTTYKDNSNWLRITNVESKKSYYLMSNGSGSENEVNATDIRNQWVHFKFTITDDTVSKEVYLNDTLVDSYSQTVSSSFFTSTTKYGISTLWSTSWNERTHLKNFKIKAL